MLVIGLTGGLGSGKTTVSEYFASLGCKIINMDKIAHQLSKPGCETFAQITTAFGTDIIDQQGYIDRDLLRSSVFQDSDQRKILEDILHPAITNQVRLLLSTLAGEICIIEIPLLNRKSQFDFIDRILVIEAGLELQKNRTQERDNLTNAQIEAIINAQIDPTERLALADDIIRNYGSKQELLQQVQSVYEYYRSLVIVKNKK